jgi:electron transport complex protein RnfC
VPQGTFRGGVHPPSHKWTAAAPIENLPVAQRLVVPMAQCLGAPAKPAVAKGDKVKRGQLIGKPDGFVSAAVHAPTSGTVTGIDRVVDAATGRQVDGIAIEADGEDAWAPEANQPRDWRAMGPEALRQAVAAAGVVGMGGATFPTHVKLTPPPGKTVDTLIINGAECEPYLTCDHRIMLESPGPIVTGLEICMAATGAQRGLLAVEDNKPDAAEALERALRAADATSSGGPKGRAEVRVVPTKYPQGAEKQMILACLGREVPTGGLPADAGVVVQNVATAIAIAEAVSQARPLTERVVTVSGDAAARPGNFRARIGTSIQVLLERAQVTGGFEQLIFGGPMMGKDQFTTDLVVMKGTSGVLVFRKAALYGHDPCIRCGACVRHCPSYLNPSRLSILGEAFLDGNLGAVDSAMDSGLMDCILCGACAYVCPARRRIVHLVELLRGERRRILQRKREKEQKQAALLKAEADKVAPKR